mmetsp:Transcript_55814/g.104669  ORF Transcript_55814/g.104669 Transcript_55814/m.104669 type:complete len:226 (+) Transcript_55814:813-1490(+)
MARHHRRAQRLRPGPAHRACTRRHHGRWGCLVLAVEGGGTSTAPPACKVGLGPKLHRVWPVVIIARAELLHKRVLLEVPHAHVPCLVPGHELHLVRVQGHRVHRRGALVLALPPRRAEVPNLHRLVFAARVHPLRVHLEPHRGHVARVGFVRPDRVAFPVLHFEDVGVGVPHGSDVVLVVGDGKRIHLGVWKPQHASALFSACLPESDFVIVTRRSENNCRCHET